MSEFADYQAPDVDSEEFDDWSPSSGLRSVKELFSMNGVYRFGSPITAEARAYENEETGETDYSVRVTATCLDDPDKGKKMSVNLPLSGLTSNGKPRFLSTLQFLAAYGLKKDSIAKLLKKSPPEIAEWITKNQRKFAGSIDCTEMDSRPGTWFSFLSARSCMPPDEFKKYLTQVGEEGLKQPLPDDAKNASEGKTEKPQKSSPKKEAPTKNTAEDEDEGGDDTEDDDII